MEYAPETFRRAFKIYQEKHGGNLADISILFVNVTEAIDEAAQHSVQATCLHRCVSCKKPVSEDVYCCDCVDEIAANR